MLSRKRKKKMKIQSIRDPEFSAYGRVLDEYDFKEFTQALSQCEAPADRVMYQPSIKELEALPIFEELQQKAFAGLPIQIGCTSGHCECMNALEYHKCSEINVAACDVVLILGKQTDIQAGRYDTALCKAFLLPKGAGVEIYATTLHYAPISVGGAPYQVSVVLPRGTNLEKPPFTPFCLEEQMCCGSNKWLLAHPDSPEAKNGRHIGLCGKNYTIKDLEF